ncbi:MAG: UbiA family prenyltransferase [candidate division WOR-3 bacterium]
MAIHQKGIVYKTNLFDAIGILLLTLSLAFGFQSAQVLNDFFDVGGDQFTRTRNPLLKSLPRRYYAALGLGLTFLSLCLAMILSFTCFLIMFTCILLSIIYSVPPVRIKIVPIVSMFILAVTALLSITMGFSLLYGNRAPDAMPKAIVIPTLLGITFGFIAKDIADIEGDKKSGTVTVPILLLKHNKSFGRLLLAIFISISYLFFPIFIPETLIGAIIFFLVTLIYTIFIKETKEWFYFLLLYSFSLYLMFIIGGIPPLK